MNKKDLSGIVIVERIKFWSTIGKQITTLTEIRESELIPKKIKETLHSLKKPNQFNKISYMLPEIWLPNLG